MFRIDDPLMEGEVRLFMGAFKRDGFIVIYLFIFFYIDYNFICYFDSLKEAL